MARRNARSESKLRVCRYCIVVLVVAIVAGSSPPRAASGNAWQTAHAGASLDLPIQLIAEAEQAYQGIRDYSCLFVKREQIRGQLQADNLIEMKVRTQPFSVYMRWLGPQPLAGQEACYVAGRNNGMLRAHSTGLTGMMGFMSLDVHDPRVMQNNRHSIAEAGIGHVIDRLGQRWPAERQLGQTSVRVADYSYNQRACTRVETMHPSSGNGQFYSYRTVVYFDKENHLPIRIETYDWPRGGNRAEGELLESYSFANLRLNVGLPESAFAY